MDVPDSRVHISLASQGEKKAATRKEVSVANFQERGQGSGEDHAGEQARMEGALERHRGCERFMDELRPGLHEGNHTDHRNVEQPTRGEGDEDGEEVSPRAKLRARLLGAFRDSLKSGQEVRNNL